MTTDALAARSPAAAAAADLEAPTAEEMMADMIRVRSAGREERESE
jgi:protein-tyrosine-phosphatase